MNKEEACCFDREFIEELIKHYHFGEFLEDRICLNFWDWYRGHVEDISVDFDTEVYAADGMTKVVFVLPETGTVIKIPYAGYEYDYCAVERDNYEKAVAAGVQDCFAWCELLMDCNASGKDFGIYVMEYVKAGSCEIEETISSDFPEIAEDYEYDMGSPDCVREVLEESWGCEIYDAFEDFTDANNINDLHSGNIGLADRGIVIIDYSGFHN